MAQARVSDFFTAKKRSNDLHAAKRRKLVLSVSDTKVSPSELNVSLGEEAVVDEPKRLVVTARLEKKTPQTRPQEMLRKQQTRSSRSTTRSRAASRKKTVDLQGQLNIKESFSQISGSSSYSDSHSNCGDTTEEVTSCWDEHDGPRTPRKKIRPLESLELTESTESRPGRRKLAAKKRITEAFTPQSDKDDTDIKVQRADLAQSARKKLSMVEERVEKQDTVNRTANGDIPPDTINRTAIDDVPPAKVAQLPSVAELQRELAPAGGALHSPLPDTPQSVHKSPVKKNKPASVTSPRLKASIEKCKELTGDGAGPGTLAEKKLREKKKVMAPEIIRERLAKCGKLEALKSKLAEMNSTLKTVRKIEADKKKLEDVVEVASSSEKGPEAGATEKKSDVKQTPAFERYEYLAKEGTPTLALPGKFQRLLTMFQGADTVVSMLQNRQETITFSKLQAAVQSMTRKNFDQKTLGQIKTVYPEAYTLRQEKNLPCFGNKISGYQLTVEADLAKSGVEGGVNEDGRPTFTASALLRRKRIFQGSLLNIVKDRHTEFLSALHPPVEVPSSKLTRWHPRFPLDSVPDIEASPLPAPPVKTYQTAKQVLENARGKLPDRVAAALEKVAAVKTPQSVPSTPAAPNSSKPVTAAHKGIPLSLLEKIRAKEAAKVKAALTRDPAEDRKTDMMGRLPTLIRSLRTHYVTEKKPTLPMASVVQKLADSYATCISHADVEAHLKLLQELAPKWIQIVEISRGKFVKIEKNADITAIIDRITNLAKSRK